MEVLLLGTAGAGGWPNPFCTCASCTSLRREEVVRGETAALVDGVLLLDCGPEAPRAAERAGRSLAGVRHLLLTHAHPDHVGPAALLWRSWARRREPLDVVGPPQALAACRDWVDPADPVRFRPVAPGERVRLSAYEISVLAASHSDGAGSGVLYDLSSGSGRLLYATDTGPLPEATVRACTGASYDLVLLEETFGDVPDHGTEHLDLTTFPLAVAALRAAGAVTDATDLVAVHLGHRNPPTAELARRLAPWGARVVPDLTSLAAGRRAERTAQAGRGLPRTAARPVAASLLPARTLVLGGARSGKSAEAERRLAAEPRVRYVATGGAREDDPEWVARVAGHRTRRPAGWETLETTDVAGALRAADRPVLVDCLTLWLTAVLDRVGAWDGDPAGLARARVCIDEFLDAWRDATVPVVAVSNEVGSGVVPATPSGRLFRDELGRLNRLVAARSDEVLLTVAGHVLRLR